MNPHDYRQNANVNDDWIACEACRGWMVPLAKCEIESANYAMPDWDDIVDNSLWGWGWIHFLALAAWGLLVTLYEEFVTAMRRRKLAKIQAEILPKFPNSQICPKCLKVKQKGIP